MIDRAAFLGLLREQLADLLIEFGCRRSEAVRIAARGAL